jgi:hypothetical protein
MLAAVEDELESSRRTQQQRIADGEAVELSPRTITAGDLVLFDGRWLPVQAVTTRSVVIRGRVADEWVETIPFHRLTGHRPA